MKKTGIVRKLDDLGRITLPIELRRILHLAERDSIEISTDDDKIILQKYEPVDIFTGEKEDLIEYVIGAIPDEDKEKLEKGIELAKEAVIEILKNGIDIAMNKFN